MSAGRILPRLLLAFLLLSPLPLAALAWFYSGVFERSLADSVQRNLAAIADKKYDQISAYFEERQANALWLARTMRIQEILPLFSSLLATKGMDWGPLQEQQRIRRKYYRTAYENMGYYDLLLINTAGNVVFSVRQEVDLGSNLDTGAYRDSALAMAHHEALALFDTQVRLDRAYAPSGGQPAIFIVTPVFKDRKIIGTLALQVDIRKLSAVAADNTGLGESGETVLAQRWEAGALYVAPLKRIPDAAFSYYAPGHGDMAKPMQFALQGKRGQGIATDYSGVEVVAAWRYLPALHWGMVVKMDTAEAFASVSQLRVQAWGVFGLLLLFAVLAAALFGRALVTPLRQLTAATRLIAGGDLGKRAPVQGWLELRELAVSFNHMAERIRAGQAMLEQRVEDRTQAMRQSMARYDALVASISAGVYTFRARADGRMGFDYVSPRFCELVGLTQEAIQSDPLLPMSVVHPDDAAEMSRRNRESVATLKPFRLECRFIVHGRTRWFHIESEPTPLEDGGSLWNGILIDVTERKQTEEGLLVASLVYRNSSEGMLVTDAGNRILSINPAFTALTGYSEEDALGKNPKILSSGLHEPEFYQHMWQTLNSTGTWQGEIWNRRKTGELFVEWLSINTIHGADGAVQRYVALFSDITEKKRSEEVIWKQANYDPLTGLPNRTMFLELLERQIKLSQRETGLLALLFIDLDRFKEVNDTLGHHQGDELLKAAAQRLLKCVRESDTVARLGGDEFIAILVDLAEDSDIDRVSQGMIEAMKAPFQLDEGRVYVSASIGITVYPNDGKDAITLLKNADQAMYAAKGQGRGRFCYFTPSMEDAAQYRMQLVQDLREAVARDQFEVYYQPIVQLDTGKLLKAEALVRWRHPKLGIVSPAAFIPIAEETGLIHEIGDWVFLQAARQLKRWQALAGPNFQVSVNKSPAQFHEVASTHDHWIDKLHALGLEGRSLVVEITESLLLNADENVMQKLLNFRDSGMQVAIDDFGTGYSALSYLNKFDIDYLKIDQTFIRNLAPGSSDLALCEAIVVMAHKIGLKVIAEGVETEQQGELLQAIGCDYGQGYLFSRPLPADEFYVLLEARSGA